jgi:gluconokinase
VILPVESMIIIVMGVSGSGKSTVGALLAAHLGVPFLDADEFHPPANVAKMAAGTPLTDEDRRPWLENLNAMLKSKDSAVLACSALKRSYREILARDMPRCTFVFLNGSLDLIRARLAGRKHRYMPASLLESQFAALEPPQDAIEVDVSQAPDACFRAIASRLGR